MTGDTRNALCLFLLFFSLLQDRAARVLLEVYSSLELWMEAAAWGEKIVNRTVGEHWRLGRAYEQAGNRKQASRCFMAVLKENELAVEAVEALCRVRREREREREEREKKERKREKERRKREEREREREREKEIEKEKERRREKEREREKKERRKREEREKKEKEREREKKERERERERKREIDLFSVSYCVCFRLAPLLPTCKPFSSARAPTIFLLACCSWERCGAAPLSGRTKTPRRSWDWRRRR